MPTNKTRINLSVPSDIEKAVKLLAKRDNQSVSSKALQLIEAALEIEEDLNLLEIAKERDTVDDSDYLDHDDIWGDLK